MEGQKKIRATRGYHPNLTQIAISCFMHQCMFCLLTPHPPLGRHFLAGGHWQGIAVLFPARRGITGRLLTSMQQCGEMVQGDWRGIADDRRGKVKKICALRAKHPLPLHILVSQNWLQGRGLAGDFTKIFLRRPANLAGVFRILKTKSLLLRVGWGGGLGQGLTLSSALAAGHGIGRGLGYKFLPQGREFVRGFRIFENNPSIAWRGGGQGEGLILTSA